MCSSQFFHILYAKRAMHAIFFCFQPNDHNKCENIHKRIAWFVCVFFSDNSWHIYVNIPDRTAWMHAIENHFQLRYFLCTHLIFTFWPLFTACISFFHENYNCLLWTFGFHRKIVQNRLFWWYVTRAIFWKNISPSNYFMIFESNRSAQRFSLKTVQLYDNENSTYIRLQLKNYESH